MTTFFESGYMAILKALLQRLEAFRTPLTLVDSGIRVWRKLVVFQREREEHICVLVIGAPVSGKSSVVNGIIGQTSKDAAENAVDDAIGANLSWPEKLARDVLSARYETTDGREVSVTAWRSLSEMPEGCATDNHASIIPSLCLPEGKACIHPDENKMELHRKVNERWFEWRRYHLWRDRRIRRSSFSDEPCKLNSERDTVRVAA